VTLWIMPITANILMKLLKLFKHLKNEDIRYWLFRVTMTTEQAPLGTGYLSGCLRKSITVPGISYPKLDIIDKIAFIGLDSTAEELHWLDRFLSEGELGRGQLSRLKKILKEPELINRKKVVYLHHHPFDFKIGMQLKDSEELRSIIENKIDMLLFGHYHVDPSSAGKIYHGMWGIKRCYNAGSSTHKNGNIGFQRIIDLSNSDPRMDYDGNFI